MKPGIQEQNAENAGNALECSLGLWEISKRILGNDIILRYWGMLKKIPENVQEDSGKC